MAKLLPGIYTDISFEEYLAIPIVDNTFLVNMRQRSAKHARWWQDHPEKTEAMAFGTRLHTYLFEPIRFAAEYAVGPNADKRTKEWKAFAADAENAGQQPIKQKDAEVLAEMKKSLQEQAIYRYIEHGETEATIIWHDKKTKVLCKGRIDYIHRDRAFLIDVKSTKNAAPAAFASAMEKYGYTQQAGFYTDGWHTLTVDVPAFVFVCIEKEPPYCSVAYEITDLGIIAGRQDYEQVLPKYAECVKSGVWPSYEPVQLLNPPDWALHKRGLSRTQHYQVFAA